MQNVKFDAGIVSHIYRKRVSSDNIFLIIQLTDQDIPHECLLKTNFQSPRLLSFLMSLIKTPTVKQTLSRNSLKSINIFLFN